LETDSEDLVEEAHHFIRFRKSYARSSIRKAFKKKMVNQRSSGKAVQKCRELAFNHDSTVDVSCAAAERKDMNKNHIGRQSQNVESYLNSVYETTCQDPEIEQLKMDEEVSTFSVVYHNIVDQNVQEESVLIESKCLLKGSYIDSDEELHHFNEDDRLVRNEDNSDGYLSIFLRAEKIISCLSRTLLDWNQLTMQLLRPHLNRGGPIYAKGRVFGFSIRDPDANSNMRVVVIYNLLAPSGSQFKSNSYAKKHPPVVVDQWSPSSSEDG
jgi:hypothetical protein